MNKSRKSDTCLNCSFSLKESDQFCPNCGQEDQDKKVSLKTLILDFLGDYFTFDSKFFRSLFPLIFKPGFLTKEYNSGKRMKYIPPLRFYIFISIIYFFVAGISHGDEKDDELNSEVAESPADTLSKGMQLSMKTGMVSFNFSGNREYSMEELEIIAQDEEKIEAFLDTLEVKKSPFKIFVAKMVLRQIVKFKKQQENFSSYFLRNVSFMMFFLMPFFAAILMLVYRKNKMFYIEHLVFSFHFHSFVFLMLTVSEIANINFVKMVVVSLMFAYFFFALAKVYPQSFWKTFLKGFLSIIMYVTSFFITFFLTLVFTFLFF